MDYVRFQHLFQAEGLRLGQAAVTDMDAPVPSCPGWTVADVVRHSVIMYTTATGQLRPARRPDPGDASKGDLLDTYTRAHAELADEMIGRNPLDPIESLGSIESLDPIQPLDSIDSLGPIKPTPIEPLGPIESLPIKTMKLDPAAVEPGEGEGPEPGTAGFLLRQMAREAAVHRADIEMAVGTPGRLDTQLALDGIDEALTVLLPAHYDGNARDGATGRTIGVHSNQHHWRLTMHRSGVTMSREQGFADAAVAGEPDELLLYLWGRRPGTIVSRTGDRTVLAAFRRRLAASMV